MRVLVTAETAFEIVVGLAHMALVALRNRIFYGRRMPLVTTQAADVLVLPAAGYYVRRRTSMALHAVLICKNSLCLGRCCARTSERHHHPNNEEHYDRNNTPPCCFHHFLLLTNSPSRTSPATSGIALFEEDRQDKKSARLCHSFKEQSTGREDARLHPFRCAQAENIEAVL